MKVRILFCFVVQYCDGIYCDGWKFRVEIYTSLSSLSMTFVGPTVCSKTRLSLLSSHLSWKVVCLFNFLFPQPWDILEYICVEQCHSGNFAFWVPWPGKVYMKTTHHTQDLTIKLKSQMERNRPACFSLYTSGQAWTNQNTITALDLQSISISWVGSASTKVPYSDIGYS